MKFYESLKPMSTINKYKYKILHCTIEKYLLQKNTKETKVARQPPGTSFSFQDNKKTTVLLPPEGPCWKQQKKTDSEESGT